MKMSLHSTMSACKRTHSESMERSRVLLFVVFLRVSPLHSLFIHTNWIKYAFEFLTIRLIHCSNVDHLTFAL